MKHYRVKFGYGSDDFYSIPETDLEKAMRAQVKGTIVAFAEGTIAGNSIIAIQPDYQRDMGWNRDYALTGEDYDEIGRKREEYTLFLEDTKLSLEGRSRDERPKEISEAVRSVAKDMTVGERG